MIGMVMALAMAGQNAPVLEISGNDIVDACRNGAGRGTTCNSYVAGVLDTYATFESLIDGSDYCVPSRVTYDQATSVVAQYLTNNPEKLHHPGALLVMFAVRDAFGCEGKANGNIFVPVEPEDDGGRNRMIIVPGPADRR